MQKCIRHHDSRANLLESAMLYRVTIFLPILLLLFNGSVAWGQRVNVEQLREALNKGYCSSTHVERESETLVCSPDDNYKKCDAKYEIGSVLWSKCRQAVDDCREQVVKDNDVIIAYNQMVDRADLLSSVIVINANRIGSEKCPSFAKVHRDIPARNVGDWRRSLPL
jgi:hypothetical protein